MQIKLNQKVIILLLSYTRSDSYKKYVFEYTKNKRFVETVLLSTHEHDEKLNIKKYTIFGIKCFIYSIRHMRMLRCTRVRAGGFTLLLQLLKSKNSVLVSSIITFTQMTFG